MKTIFFTFFLIVIFFPNTSESQTLTLDTKKASPPYGWWESVPPAGRPGSRPPQTATTKPPETSSPEAAAKPAENDEKSSEGKKEIRPVTGVPTTSSLFMNRSPIQSMLLRVQGTSDYPTEAPEAFYRFTARTLERHGGVALGSTWHQAKVTLGENGVWKADFRGTTFGTVEVFSRFKLGDKTFYSQLNYLHFLTPDDAKGLTPEPEVPEPKDWPILKFPASSYNDLPFRGLQTGKDVDFELKLPEGQKIPETVLILEPRKPDLSPVLAPYNQKLQKYTYSAQDDPTLGTGDLSHGGGTLSSGTGTGPPPNKPVVAVALVPDSNDTIAFSMVITRSRWSYRKIGWGLGLTGVCAVIIAVIVIKRRKRFKFNDRN